MKIEMYLILAVGFYAFMRLATLAYKNSMDEYGSSYMLQSRRNVSDAFMAISLKQIYNIVFAVGVVACGILFFLTGSFLLVIFIGALAMVIPYFVHNRMREKRLERFEEQFPEALAMLSSTMRAGVSMPLAIAKVAEEMEAPLTQEFGLIRRDIQVGKTEEAFRDLGRRVPLESVQLFTTAVITAQKMGGNLAEMSDSIADTIRGNIDLRRELRVMTAEGKMQGILMGAMPFVVAGILYLVNPEIMMPLFNTLIGNLLIAIVIVMELMGALIIRALLKIED